MDDRFVRLERCKADTAGGFRPPDGVRRCSRAAGAGVAGQGGLTRRARAGGGVPQPDQVSGGGQHGPGARADPCVRPLSGQECGLAQLRTPCVQRGVPGRGRAASGPAGQRTPRSPGCCLQVRAANLSGDCHVGHEWNRGNFGLRGHHQVCVRRRAQLSVAMNPSCTGARAKAAVDSAFQPCFEDTAPFDRIP